jgi:ketosteroid isomerase-like protein
MSGLDALIEEYHARLGEIVNGDAEGYLELLSQRDDVTVANPFFPVTRGRAAVEDRVRRAASNYEDGEITGFEQIAKCETPELAYLVEVERYRAKVGGSEEPVSLAIRVTSVFRPEEGTWKVVHRHADPITTEQPPESVIPT